MRGLYVLLVLAVITGAFARPQSDDEDHQFDGGSGDENYDEYGSGNGDDGNGSGNGDDDGTDDGVDYDVTGVDDASRDINSNQDVLTPGVIKESTVSPVDQEQPLTGDKPTTPLTDSDYPENNHYDYGTDGTDLPPLGKETVDYKVPDEDPDTADGSKDYANTASPDVNYDEDLVDDTTDAPEQEQPDLSETVTSENTESDIQPDFEPETPVRETGIVEAAVTKEKTLFSWINDFWGEKYFLAALLAGAIIGFIIISLVILFICYTVRKSDEGSYIIDKNLTNKYGPGSVLATNSQHSSMAQNGQILGTGVPSGTDYKYSSGGAPEYYA